VNIRASTGLTMSKDEYDLTLRPIRLPDGRWKIEALVDGETYATGYGEDFLGAVSDAMDKMREKILTEIETLLGN
jgi:hypothetical protein